MGLFPCLSNPFLYPQLVLWTFIVMTLVTCGFYASWWPVLLLHFSYQPTYTANFTDALLSQTLISSSFHFIQFLFLKLSNLNNICLRAYKEPDIMLGSRHTNRIRIQFSWSKRSKKLLREAEKVRKFIVIPRSNKCPRRVWREGGQIPEQRNTY